MISPTSSADRTAPDPTASGAPQGGANVRSRITEALRAAIVTGELEPGQVYSAPRLGAQFGVSATPVREAMLDLLKEGLVRTVRNKGFEVLAPSPVALHDILEVRQLLEVPIVRRLAERGVREADLVALLPLAQETVRAADELDIVGHVAADMKFHLALLDLWGNDEITELVRALRSRSRLAGLWSSDNHEAYVRKRPRASGATGSAPTTRPRRRRRAHAISHEPSRFAVEQEQHRTLNLATAPECYPHSNIVLPHVIPLQK